MKNILRVCDGDKRMDNVLRINNGLIFFVCLGSFIVSIYGGQKVTSSLNFRIFETIICIVFCFSTRVFFSPQF